jgi:benzoyl-CoA 2,3-dioxygenase component A
MNAPAPDVITQHLIDPEVCIRCNTCEETCPVDAITHDSRNYVVDADKCNLCMACVPPCPTGSIDNWRKLIRVEAYSVDEQLTWDELPVQRDLPAQDGPGPVSMQGEADRLPPAADDARASGAGGSIADASAPALAPALPSAAGSSRPPWSAAHPYLNLHTHREPALATVAGNFRVTELGTDSDTHHIVLDFGSLPFPVLEGQSLGILPPGTDATGRPHHARQYSIASPRDGERPGYNNVALTVKRVLVDHDGRPVRGVASNYLCDLAKGDRVQVLGPFGNSFLMPNHAGAHLLMICTGTGSAPMRAMTERRRRAHVPIGGGGGGGAGSPEGHAAKDGRLMLFFGARSQRELPYFGPLARLPRDFIDIELAYSRSADHPKRYVQDALRERASDVAALLADPATHVYVCGLKAMEAGVLQALQEVADGHSIDWPALHQLLKAEGRLHFETY